MSPTPPGVLICDENAARRAALVRLLERSGTEVAAVATLPEAVRRLSEPNEVGVLIAGLPGLAGGERPAGQRLRARLPGLTVIGLSRAAGPGPGLALVERGIVDHVLSPDDAAGLFAAAKSGLEKRRLESENELLRKGLRRQKAELGRNARKAAELEAINEATLENLMTALDLRDVETYGHSQTVAKYTQVLARLLGIEDRLALENIRKGALLHDIGKIAIPDAILKKRGSLTEEEWRKIRLHPTLGYGLIKEIQLVEDVGNIILFHHERFDGSGYPRGLKRERIPLEARIFALADALDAITAPRPYRKARGFEVARVDIVRNAGTQFDPKVVDAFCSLSLEKWERIRLETTSFIPNIEEFSRLFAKIKD